MKWEMKDISQEVYGKYQHGFIHRGFEYSDEDEGLRLGTPKFGAIPSPRHKDRRPWYGEFIEIMRRLFGKPRMP